MHALRVVVVLRVADEALLRESGTGGASESCAEGIARRRIARRACAQQRLEVQSPHAEEHVDGGVWTVQSQPGSEASQEGLHWK